MRAVRTRYRHVPFSCSAGSTTPALSTFTASASFSPSLVISMYACLENVKCPPSRMEMMVVFASVGDSGCHSRRAVPESPVPPVSPSCRRAVSCTASSDGDLPSRQLRRAVPVAFLLRSVSPSFPASSSCDTVMVWIRCPTSSSARCLADYTSEQFLRRRVRLEPSVFHALGCALSSIRRSCASTAVMPWRCHRQLCGFQVLSGCERGR